MSHSAAELRNLSDEISQDAVKAATRIGGGGFGDVFVLTDAKRGKLALKSLRQTTNPIEVAEQRRRARREAETWSKLQHPNVLEILGIIDTPEYFYLVSPFAENGSLDHYIRTHPDTDRLRLLAEVASGLAFIHGQGIVHGDVKAANVLVSADTHALLCDFGLTKVVDGATSTAVKGVGSLRWMSPEILAEGGSKTPASDAWAFGMTVYEVISGVLPFYKFIEYAVVFRKIVFEHRLPPKQPTHSENGISFINAWKVASGCWHRRPDKRISMEAACAILLSPAPISPSAPSSWHHRVRKLARSASDSLVSRPLLSITGSVRDFSRTVRRSRSDGDSATFATIRSFTTSTLTSFTRSTGKTLFGTGQVSLVSPPPKPYCGPELPTKLHFHHALARSLVRGSRGKRKRPSLPEEVVTAIMRHVGVTASEWTEWQSTALDMAIMARSQRIMRQLIFTSEEVHRDWIRDSAAFQLTTVSKDQGWRSDPNVESSTWYEVGIVKSPDDETLSATTCIDDDSDTRKHPTTGEPLRWTSHFNKVAHDSFEFYAGVVFGPGHEVWDHLRSGDRLGVWQCAQYPLWTNSAKEVSLRVRGWYALKMPGS